MKPNTFIFFVAISKLYSLDMLYNKYNVHNINNNNNNNIF